MPRRPPPSGIFTSHDADFDYTWRGTKVTIRNRKGSHITFSILNKTTLNVDKPRLLAKEIFEAAMTAGIIRPDGSPADPKDRGFRVHAEAAYAGALSEDLGVIVVSEVIPFRPKPSRRRAAKLGPEGTSE